MFGVVVFFATGLVSYYSRGNRSTGRFGDANAFTEAWFFDAPMGGLVGLAVSLFISLLSSMDTFVPPDDEQDKKEDERDETEGGHGS